MVIMKQLYNNPSSQKTDGTSDIRMGERDTVVLVVVDFLHLQREGERGEGERVG